MKVVRRLRAAGFTAYWAGGSVRDILLGRLPKDYDVATSARPEEVRSLFGRRRTIPIGAAFGIVTVVGPRRAGQVEVATFRRDSPYVDGRHPDHVEYASPEEDARRRDFTINGLFYDPLVDDPSARLIDYVGGRRDIERRILRTIGDPHERFGEDWLRMLRAVRFTATYQLTPDRSMIEAVRAHADKILGISAERITAELRWMLVHASRRRAVELLHEWHLLAEIAPQLDQLAETPAWEEQLDILERLESCDFALSLAVLLETLARTDRPRLMVRSVTRRWRLSNAERDTVVWLLERRGLLDDVERRKWSELQPVVVDERFARLADWAVAAAQVRGQSTEPLEALIRRSRLPRETVDPPPLLTGDDLTAAGWKPGPRFGRVLRAVRSAQLDEQITTREEALAMARRLVRSELPEDR